MIRFSLLYILILTACSANLQAQSALEISPYYRPYFSGQILRGGAFADGPGGDPRQYQAPAFGSEGGLYFRLFADKPLSLRTGLTFARRRLAFRDAKGVSPYGQAETYNADVEYWSLDFPLYLSARLKGTPESRFQLLANGGVCGQLLYYYRYRRHAREGFSYSYSLYSSDLAAQGYRRFSPAGYFGLEGRMRVTNRLALSLEPGVKMDLMPTLREAADMKQYLYSAGAAFGLVYTLQP